MGVRSNLVRALVAFVGVALISGTGSAQPEAPVLAFAHLEHGLWEIRVAHGQKIESRSVCIGDPTAFIQLQHRDSACSRVVITNEPQAVTIHYTCPANGYGRTSLRLQTPRIARIDTQGIFDNAPFAFRAEARRKGPCRASR